MPRGRDNHRPVFAQRDVELARRCLGRLVRAASAAEHRGRQHQLRGARAAPFERQPVTRVAQLRIGGGLEQRGRLLAAADLEKREAPVARALADDDATASSAWESASGESWASGRDVALYAM